MENSEKESGWRRSMWFSQTAALLGDLGINTQKCLKEQDVLHQAETSDSPCFSGENSASFKFRFL